MLGLNFTSCPMHRQTHTRKPPLCSGAQYANNLHENFNFQSGDKIYEMKNKG